EAEEGTESRTRVLGRDPLRGRLFFPTRVHVKVSAEGARPTGRVVIRKEDEVIARNRLRRSGHAMLWVRPRHLERGMNHLVAEYKGTDAIAGSQDEFRIRMRRPWWRR